MRVVLGAWSRRVIGWSIADHLRTEVVTDAVSPVLSAANLDVAAAEIRRTRSRGAGGATRHNCPMAGESLATQFLHTDLDVTCPACRYPVWVRYSEIVAQAAVLCPCCRGRIWLRDAQGSAQTAGDVIERQAEEMLKGLWK
jgi:ribosomal protein S27E